MRIGLVIADFEMNYTTSFKHTARVKYGVDFDTSNVDALGLKLNDLKNKLALHQNNDVQVGFEITLEHVIHVDNLLNQILEKYREVFKVLPPNMKIYDINRKLKEAETPSAKELAKEVLTEVLNPEIEVSLKKSDRIKAEAEKFSKQRVLNLIKKNSAKGK